MLLSEAAPNDPPGSDSLALLCRDKWDKPSSLNLKYYFTPHQEYAEATGKEGLAGLGRPGAVSAISPWCLQHREGEG